MESEFSLKNNCKSDEDLLNLIAMSFNQIRMYYLSRKKGMNPLIYEEGSEVDLINLLITCSQLFIDKTLVDIDNLKNKKINCLVVKGSDLLILKYIVDFYWHNSPSAKLNTSQLTYNQFNAFNQKIFNLQKTCSKESVIECEIVNKRILSLV